MQIFPLVFLTACGGEGAGPTAPAPPGRELSELGASDSRLPSPCVGLAYDGRDLVVGTVQGVVEIDESGKRRTYPDPGGQWYTVYPGQPFALSPDGREVAVGQPSGEIRVVTRGSGRVRVIEGDGRVVSLVWLSDGRLLSTRASGWPHAKAGTKEGSIWSDSLSSSTRLAPTHCRVDLTIRPFGSDVLTHCGAGPVEVLDLTTLARSKLPSPVGNLHDVWTKADGSRLVGSSWPVSSSWRASAAAPEATVEGYVQAAAIAGDMVVLGAPGRVRVLRGDVLTELAFPEGSAAAVAVTSDGARIAACNGHAVYEWDGLTGALRVEPPAGNTSAAQVVAMSPDGRHAATADVHHIVIWTLPAGVQRSRFEAIGVSDLMLEGDRVYARSDEGIHGWTLDGEGVAVGVEPVFPLPAPVDPVSVGALGVDIQGDLGITGHIDGTARIWDRVVLEGLSKTGKRP